MRNIYWFLSILFIVHEMHLYNGKQMDTFSKRNYITMKMLTNIFQIHSTM
jgi:hypothetical protein